MPFPLGTDIDSPGIHYLAFIESNGDNITWTMGSIASEQSFFDHPARGPLPFGWSTTVCALGQLGPDAWNYYVHAAMPGDGFVRVGLTGYGFLDDTPPSLVGRRSSIPAWNAPTSTA